jgi:predicted  nucleic acid-binding Zn-ribbon protein
MTRTIEHKPRAARTGQPLALVDCTGCGHRFTSAAKSHTRCPDCGRNLRVGRAPKRRAPGKDRVVNGPAVRQENRQESRSVRQPPPFWPMPPTVPSPISPVVFRPASPDDDGETYVIERGRVVLGTWESGSVVPAVTLPAGYLAVQVAARGWHRQAHGRDICQVVRVWAAVADLPPALESCQRPATRGVLCEKCFGVLRSPA